MRRYFIVILVLLTVLRSALALAQESSIPEAEAESREQLLRRITSQSAINGLAIAPDGILAAAGDVLRIWDGIVANPLVSLVGLYPGPFQAAAYSPDGTSIIGLSREGEMNAWGVGPLRFKASFIDRTTAGVAGRNKAHYGSHANAIAFSPGGDLVVSAAADTPPMKVWNAETGAMIRPLEVPGSEEVTAVAFSPDGKLLAFASQHDAVLMKTSDWTVLRTVNVPHGRINSIAFAGSGAIFGTASEDGAAQLWKTETGEPVAALTAHTAAVRGIAFSPDGELVATASLDKSVRIWSPDGKPLGTIAHSRPVYTVAFTEAGTELATGAADNTVRLWRVPDWRLTQRMTGDEQTGVSAFLFQKDAPPPQDSTLPVTSLAGSPLKSAVPKPLAGPDSRELPLFASQILRSIQTGQMPAFDALLSPDQFTIDGPLPDRETLRARVFDTNRLRVLINAYASQRDQGRVDVRRFRSLREIVQNESGTAAYEILDRAKEGNQQEAATIVIHWKNDPMNYGLRDYPQFGIARTNGIWRIVEVAAPLDIANPSRYSEVQQRIGQLRSFVDRLLRDPSLEAEPLKSIVREHPATLAFEIKFPMENRQWWAPDLNTAEIVFRWDGDPSEFNSKDYPRIRLRLEAGSWKQYEQF